MPTRKRSRPEPEEAREPLTFTQALRGDHVRNGSGQFLIVQKSHSERWILLQKQGSPAEEVRQNESEFDRERYELEEEPRAKSK